MFARRSGSKSKIAKRTKEECCYKSLEQGYFRRFDVKIAATVAEETNLPFVTAENKFEALGKWAEGIVHLGRVACLKEPEDPKRKSHYYDALVLLASALYNEGRKTEAAKYLRMAAADNSDYNELLEQCENDEDNVASDLVDSRRRNY
ncbi:hypothetical protein F0562_022459 [Nyssa sinensis]|uniref:Uncharacterized protein n=1 Tax=Nyssa sinensis TaxID=561372 RepID=A0A5J5BTC2_9ASTE|nr:hypothetical protein F0562_022459 [Nyssa sinensis]